MLENGSPLSDPGIGIGQLLEEPDIFMTSCDRVMFDWSIGNYGTTGPVQHSAGLGKPIGGTGVVSWRVLSFVALGFFEIGPHATFGLVGQSACGLACNRDLKEFTII